jgi:hypothetical protein
MTRAAKRAGDRAGTTYVPVLNTRDLVEAGRRVGSRYLANYERFVGQVIAAQEKLAKQAENDVVKSMVEAQVDLTRQVTSAYTSAARKLIR